MKNSNKKRLTYWSAECGCWAFNYSRIEAGAKLAAYENTGLEPDEVAALQCDAAEEQGRLVLLPCKAGEDEEWI